MHNPLDPGRPSNRVAGTRNIDENRVTKSTNAYTRVFSN